MNNHEFAGWASDHSEEYDSDRSSSDYENIDQYAVDKESHAELEAQEYEKRLDKVDRQTIYKAESNVDRLLADLTWRGLGESPRERYNNEHRKKEIDRLRLFSEAETLFGYKLRKDRDNIPESKFFRHLAETCSHDYRVVDTVPLSESETEHFNRSAGDFVKYLSTENNKERTFANYVRSLVRMCMDAYGDNSRALMYLCDDLSEMLAPQKDTPSNIVDNKSKIIDRLIERKLDAVQKIAMDKTEVQDISLIGFTGVLDLPEGIEKHTVKGLVGEGVPSLYGYDEE